MKTLRFFLVMAVMLLAANNADAQNTMRVHQKDGTIHEYSIADVDFVDWYEKTAPEGEGTEPEFEDIEVNGTTYHLGISGAIDLGLSVKWATMNIGASSPGDCGDYYAWGETVPYYTEGHSQDNPCNSWRDGKTGYNWDSYFDFVNGSSSSFTKYAIDKKTILDPEDDVAHVKLGGNWRMPTDSELTELREKCSWVWTTYGDHEGYVFMGSTGNAIFLPAAGFRSGGSLSDAVWGGYYWSSSLIGSRSSCAYGLLFLSSYPDWSSYYRWGGLSVRPVCP